MKPLTLLKALLDNSFIEPIYFVIEAPADSVLEEQLPLTHNAFIYVAKRRVNVGDKPTSIGAEQLAVLKEGGLIKVVAEQESTFIFVAGKPINEPVERAGPFVMNTCAELEQAFADYRNG